MSQSHDKSAAHGSVQSYLTGFVLSVVLTALPFWMVINGSLTHKATLYGIVVFAVVQIVVHLKYFLHLDFTDKGRLNTLSFLFTTMVIVLLIGLSVWIITTADQLMMR